MQEKTFKKDTMQQGVSILIILIMSTDYYEVVELNNTEKETIQGGTRLSYALGWICGKLQNIAEKLDTNTQWLA